MGFILSLNPAKPALQSTSSFSSAKTSQLATIPKTAQFGFSVSPDEHRILYTQLDRRGSDLMRVENFR